MNHIDITLEEIESRKLLSSKAIIICKSAGLNSLGQIIDHFKNYGSFMNIENCGKRYGIELINFSKKYIDLPPEFYNNSQNTLKKKSDLKETKDIDEYMLFNKFNADKLEIFHRQLDFLLSKLSVRSYNASIAFCRIEGINQFIKTILDSHFKIKDLYEANKKSENSFNKFKEELSLIIKNLSDFDKRKAEKIESTETTQIFIPEKKTRGRKKKTDISSVKEKSSFDKKDISEPISIMGYNKSEKEDLNNKIQELFSKLDSRTKKGAIKLYRSRDLINFIDTIYSPDFSFTSLPKMGQISGNEFDRLKQELTTFIKSIKNSNEIVTKSKVEKKQKV